MIILHGAPVFPVDPPHLAGFALWGEGPFLPDRHRPEHPRSLDADELLERLRNAGAPLPPFGTGPGRIRKTRLVVTVPVGRGRPVPSMPTLRDDEDYVTAPHATLKALEIEALLLPPGRSLELLLVLGEEEASDRRSPTPGDDLEYWMAVASWAFDLLLKRRVVPSVEEGRGHWRPVLTDSEERQRFHLFASAMPPASRALTPVGYKEATGGFPAASVVLRSYLDEAVDSLVRDLIREILPADRRKAGTGSEAALVASLIARREGDKDGEPVPAVVAPALARAVNAWSLPLLEALPEGELRLGLRLQPPSTEEGEPEQWRIAYHLEPVDDPTLKLFAEEIWSDTSPSLGRLGRRFLNPQETLLVRLGAAAPFSEPVRRSLLERQPVGAPLSVEEAHRFLTSDAALLGAAGVNVLLPSGGRLARVSVRLTGAESQWKAGVAVTRLGLSRLVDFDWRVAIGDTLLTPDEFESLAQRKVPLVEIRGEWMLLDPESVSRTLALFKRRPSGNTTLGDFLRLSSGLGDDDETAFAIENVHVTGWLASVLEPESARAELSGFEAPKSLVGTLRPYQARGVAWLRMLTSRGLGGCLADDMGLGKTVQFLAALLTAREAGEEIRPSLLICPTSVAENWKQEARRFAPSLSVAIHHGPDRAGAEEFNDLIAENDLVVTTYPLAHRDRTFLSEVTWEFLALDEAQNIKNPGTAQSRAVRSLKARRRAALTGTPLENRLSELKSILDFLNPGLLGSDESFRRTFSVPIERERDAEAAERLRRLTGPFLLRRSKTDPSIAPDLPDKIETKEWVGLTREQATLYRATTRALLEGIGRARGQSRRAKVLLLLLRLKQICNHPALFLGDGSRLENRSGKLTRLLDMLEETEAENRPALLFTQFAEMGHLLVRALKERFDKEVLFLHGGIPRAARAEMVRRFQDDEEPPLFFVLSLKAGGSGLNLTRASHVFHIDRWWNPAVEDQATDRAFRIGQTQHVQVHKFICRGTLEERIDGMIDEKKDLAKNIIGAGEGWLTELSNDELARLVALSSDAVDRLED